MTEPTRPVSIEDLLSHSEWVRRLAYSLAKDADAAQDLIQDAWIAAISSPPSHGSNLKSWWRTLVRNKWTDRRLSDAARADRERVSARPESVPDTTELVRRADASSLLAGFVAAEEEPYRSVLLLRYYDDLLPAAIAERLGVSVNTVNSRLQRGHARLRERLERVRGPDWRLALLPLLEWPVAPAPAPATSSSAPRAGRPLIATGAGVLAVVAGWLWLFSLFGPGPGVRGGAEVGSLRPTDPGSGRGAGHAPRIVKSPEAADSGAGAETAALPDAAAPAASDAGGTTRVRVRGRFAEQMGTTTVAALLTPYISLKFKERGTPRPLTLTSPEFEFDVPLRDEAGRRVWSWEIEVDDPEFLRLIRQVRVPLPEEGADGVDLGEIRLERAGHVTGTVTWEAGEFAGPADVVTVPDEKFPIQFDRSKVELGGRFRLRAIPGRPMFLVTATSDSAPTTQPFTAAGGAEVDVGVLELKRGLRVTGRIVCPKFGIPEDAPLSVIAVTVPRPAWSVDGHLFAPVDGRAVRYSQKIRPDSKGEFVAEGLGSLPLHLNLYNVNRFPKDLLKAAQTAVDPVSLRADAVIDGGLIRVLVRVDGSPFKGADVELQPEKEWPGKLKSDPDGRADFIGIPGARYTVAATAVGCSAETEKVTAPSIDSELAVTLDLRSVPKVEGATWSVTFSAPGGPPPTVASFAFFPSDPAAKPTHPKLKQDVVAKDGVFRVTEVPPGTWWVLCQPGSTWQEPTGFLVVPVFERAIQSGAESPETIEASPGGRLVVTACEADGSIAQHATGKLFDAAHRPVRTETRHFNHAGAAGGGSMFSTFGATDICPALAPGRYTLEMTSVAGSEVATKSFDVEVVAGKVTHAEVKFDPR